MDINAWKATGKHFDYKGQAIFYHDEGTGPPLLLIHGFPTSSWDWCRVWPELTKHFRVIAVDMMGFGYSPKPPDYPYSLFDQADLHEALLQDLELRAVHVLAHDYGDTIAQELMARQKAGPHNVSLLSVCMLNGGIIPGKHRPRLIQTLLISPLGPLVGRLMTEKKFHKSFAAIFGPDTQPTAEELASFWALVACHGGRRVMHRLIQYMRERRENYTRWVDVLESPPVPLRLIFGELDPVSGKHMADEFSRLNLVPDLIRLSRIGHYPQTEDPEAVLQHHRVFIAGLDK